MVGLGELRAHLGERWPELSERVHGLARMVIARHLSQGDVFDVQGDDGYIVLFAQLSKVEADFKCRVIAKEIATKLLGSEWDRLSVVDGISIELQRAAFASGDFDRALADAVAVGRPLGKVKGGEPSDKPPAAGPTPTFSAVATPPDASQRPIARHPASPGRAAAAGQGDGYEPIWDFGVQALLHFRLTSEAAGKDATPLAAAQADIAALSKALFDLGQLAQHGRRLPIICPVHGGTLAYRPWRRQIVRLLEASPPYAVKLVTLEVIVGREATNDWPRELDALCRGLPVKCAARAPLDADLSGLATGLSIRQINLDLSAGVPAGKAAIAGLERFARRCEAVGLPCGVLGLRTRALALAASAAGFKELSGPVVHPPVLALGHAVQFDLSTLYRDLLPLHQLV